MQLPSLHNEHRVSRVASTYREIKRDKTKGQEEKQGRWKGEHTYVTPYCISFPFAACSPRDLPLRESSLELRIGPEGPGFPGITTYDL